MPEGPQAAPASGATLAVWRRDSTIGLLSGALLFGGPISVAHLLHNWVESPVTGLASLVLFALLYGCAVGAALCALGWLLRLAAFPRFRLTGDPAVWAACLLNLAVFQPVVFYGLTYEQVPWFEPRTFGGMALFLIATGILLGSVVCVATLVVAAGVRRLAGAGQLRRLLVAAAAVLVAAHVALPIAFRLLPETKPASFDPATLVARPGPPVALLGFDGLDPDLLLELIDDGQLPNLSEFVQDGTFGRLETYSGANSAVIWASLYTGESPDRHRVHDFYRVRFPGSGAGLFPVHRTYFKELIDLFAWAPGISRRFVNRLDLPSPPIWEIADRAGVPTAVVDGYFYSFPAQPQLDPGSRLLAYGLNDTLASPGNAGVPRASVPAANGAAPASSSAPGNAGVSPASGPVDSTVAWFAQPPDLPPEVEAAAASQPDLAWQSRAAVALLEDRARRGQAPPRFFSLYTHEPDTVSHQRWRWAEPERFPFVSRAGIDEHGQSVADVYRRIDALVGELRRALGPETVFVIASDHGQSPTFVHRLYTQHRHGPDGVLLLHGPGIRRGHRLDSSQVLDVFPTVLALLGLPMPADTEGRVLDDAFTEPPDLGSHSRVATYRGAWQPVDTVGGPDIERTRQEIERLKAMGYL